MSLPDEYRAIHESAVVGALASRSFIAVAGADRASFLQGLLTNDIAALTPGSGCYAAWLTPQGRMITDLEVLESGDLMLLDVPVDTHAATLERLDQFLFSEDVQIASLASELTSVWTHGPQAAAMLGRVVDGISDPQEWTPYRLEKGSFGAAPAVVVRNDQLLVPGYCVYLSHDARKEFMAAVQREGAVVLESRSDERSGRSLPHEALTAARIEAGYPLFGVDMAEDTIPLEAGIEGRAISLTKGCYVGQEVIIRVLHRGHGRVAKRLVAFRTPEPLRAGARVTAGGKDVGFITSAAISPALGPIALGYVHREFVEPGSLVVVTVDERPIDATVAARPIAT